MTAATEDLEGLSHYTRIPRALYADNLEGLRGLQSAAALAPRLLQCSHCTAFHAQIRTVLTASEGPVAPKLWRNPEAECSRNSSSSRRAAHGCSRPASPSAIRLRVLTSAQRATSSLSLLSRDEWLLKTPQLLTFVDSLKLGGAA
jgi:hypothetical protein